MPASAESPPRAVRPNHYRERERAWLNEEPNDGSPLATARSADSQNVSATLDNPLTDRRNHHYEYETVNVHIALWAVGALLAFRARAAGDGDVHRSSQRRQWLGRVEGDDHRDQRPNQRQHQERN